MANDATDWGKRLERVCEEHGLRASDLAERFGYATDPRDGWSEREAERMVGAAHRELERETGQRWRDVLLWRAGGAGREARANLPQRVERHAEGGYDWGGESAGALDLALNVLLAYGAEQEEAEELYQRFAREVLAELPRDGARLTRRGVDEWRRRAGAGADAAAQAEAGVSIAVPEVDEEEEGADEMEEPEAGERTASHEEPEAGE